MTYPAKAGLWRARADTFFGVSLKVISAVFFGRLMIDIGTRMFYPFIPQLATGLGLTVVAFSQLLFFRALTGMAGPVFGVLSDRFGRRKVMATGLLGQAAGLIVLAVVDRWWAALPLVLSGLSVAAYIPAQQAYIGDQATYQKRGRALASVEFSWAATAIFILPVIGWLMNASSWRSTFLVVGLLSLVGAAIVWRRLPPAGHRARTGASMAEVRAICFQPNVLAAVGTATLIFASGTAFITLWSIWLEADFGLSATALGLVAMALGLAELSGSGLSSLFIDRLGQRRGSLAGLLLSVVLLLGLPLTRGSLLVIIPGLFLLGAGLEFTIVSLIPLYGEQAPAARGTVFSLTLFGTAIGSALGAPLAATLWELSGLWAVCLVTASCLLACFVLVLSFLREE